MSRITSGLVEVKDIVIHRCKRRIEEILFEREVEDDKAIKRRMEDSKYYWFFDRNLDRKGAIESLKSDYFFPDTWKSNIHRDELTCLRQIVRLCRASRDSGTGTIFINHILASWLPEPKREEFHDENYHCGQQNHPK